MICDLITAIATATVATIVVKNDKEAMNKIKEIKQKMKEVKDKSTSDAEV